MSRVRFEDGTVINFEGTPSPEDIDEAYASVTGGAPSADGEQPSIESAAQNIVQHFSPGPMQQQFPPNTGIPLEAWVQSGQNYAGNMAQAVMHPIQTAKGIGNLVLGGAQKLIPGTQSQEPVANLFGEFMKNRYGSLEAIHNTYTTDPVGFLGDASMLVSGMGGAASRIPRLASAGNVAMKAAASMDPLSVTMRAASVVGKTPVVSGGISRVSQSIESSAGGMINSLIKPSNKQFSYGKNPGAQVAKEGIVASSLEDLASKIDQRKMQVGQQIGTLYDLPIVASKRLNVTTALDPINKALEAAHRNPRTNQNIIIRLQNLRDDLLGVQVLADGKTTMATRNLTQVSPREAFELKQTIGDLTKWTGNHAEDSVVNAALKQTYSKLNQSLASVVPGVKPANEAYGNLLEASNATRNQVAAAHRRGQFGMMDFLASGYGLGRGGIDDAIVGLLFSQGAKFALRSPLIRTGLASAIANSTPAQIATLFQKVPGLKSEATRLGLLAGTGQQRVTNSQTNGQSQINAR